MVNARKAVGIFYRALNAACEGSHLIKPENQHVYEQFIESVRVLIRDVDRYSEPPVRIQRSITEFITSNNAIDGDQTLKITSQGTNQQILPWRIVVCLLDNP